MIKVGSIVNIKPSEALKLERLMALAGREAEILEVLTSLARTHKGYMVKLTQPYQQEDIWFIPQESIEDDDE